MNRSGFRRIRLQRGSILLRVALFSVALTLVFTLVANMLPQVEGEVPEETEIDLAGLTMDDFIALGEDLFSGKGTCTLCHNNLGRAPDILQLNMDEISRQRLADERYRGKASNTEEYLRESMLDPGIYVVRGYGKKGTNDSESPMPAVDVAPILLNPVEIDAVIAFMQAKDGNEVSVSLPSAMPPAPAGQADSAPSPAVETVAADSPAALLRKYACSACHSIADSVSPVGPDLNGIGDRLDRAQISESIIDPNATIAEGFAAGMMPDTFAAQMTVRELNILVDYLASQKAGQ